MAAVEVASVITCPVCGHRAREQMPPDACQFFYVCGACGLSAAPIGTTAHAASAVKTPRC